jgi:hypothetical protein
LAGVPGWPSYLEVLRVGDYQRDAAKLFRFLPLEANAEIRSILATVKLQPCFIKRLLIDGLVEGWIGGGAGWTW